MVSVDSLTRRFVNWCCDVIGTSIGKKSNRNIAKIEKRMYAAFIFELALCKPLLAATITPCLCITGLHMVFSSLKIVAFFFLGGVEWSVGRFKKNGILIWRSLNAPVYKDDGSPEQASMFSNIMNNFNYGTNPEIK